MNNLENTRHDSTKLQKDFNRYGKNFFKFESLQLDTNNNYTRRKIDELNYINCIPEIQRYNQIVFNDDTFDFKTVMINGAILCKFNAGICFVK